MSTTEYAPGWYPDTNLAPGTLRWWDGTQWTHHIQPAPTVQQPPPAAVATAMHPAGLAAGAAVATAGAHQFASGAVPVAQGQKPSLYQQNPKSMTAVCVVAVYVLVAVTTGFVFLGIVPVMLAFRALGRGERLAPLAVAAAALAVLVAISALSRV